MLGPLAVDPSCRALGLGAELMTCALKAAKARGHGAVILLGDAAYYARFGFSADKTGEIALPGPFERDRLLGLELRHGALDGISGSIAATGAPASQKAARQMPPRGHGSIFFTGATAGMRGGAGYAAFRSFSAAVGVLAGADFSVAGNAKL